jgi:hypothetical protein
MIQFCLEAFAAGQLTPRSFDTTSSHMCVFL